MIHRNVFHNDSLKPIEKVRLSPGQAGIICGWGIFTTMRISRGEAFAYERHWRRLEKDASIIHLPMPYSAAKVRVNLHEVIRANKVESGAARVYLINNNVGFWQSDEPRPETDLIIYTASAARISRADPPRKSENTDVTPARLWRASRAPLGFPMSGQSPKRKRLASTKLFC